MATILVVDDEKDTVGLLRYMLEKDGHQVLEAFDGEGALKAVGLDPAGGEGAAPPVLPDIILLDVMMPKMDGYSVYARLQQSERTKAIPVVVLTAKGKMWELFENAQGVTAFMEKPFDPKYLRSHVKEALAKKPAPPPSGSPGAVPPGKP
ncbi:MAG: response regulator [Elusimicrobia bacterium]|nr:response regulator [Elusimicrobiota bacterium]